MTRPDGTSAGWSHDRRTGTVTAGVRKKLINDPFDAVDEMLEGFVAAHGDVVRLADERVVARVATDRAKVGLVIGGGSGP